MASLNYLGYIIAKIKQKVFTHNPETISDYYRLGGMEVGYRCILCDYYKIGEPKLVIIKDDCVISSDVVFVTHDHSINKVTDKGSNLFGKIVIGNNCFIGQRSTLLYGVELADNIIVGAGSVVVESFDESNIIIAGNPAKKIGTWDSYKNKYENKAAFREKLPNIIGGNSNKLIKKIAKHTNNCLSYEEY